MKKLLITGIVLMGLASCQQENIAYIDNTKLINDYQEKTDLDAEIKTRIDGFNRKRDSISQAFQAEYGAAEAQSKKLSQKAAQELAQNLNEKGQYLGQQLQMEEQQLQKMSQSKMDTLVKKVKSFIKEYGKEHNYTYILGANEAGSVLYGDESKDITAAVLEALHKEYKTPAEEK